MPTPLKEVTVTQIKKQLLEKKPSMKGDGWKLSITLRKGVAFFLDEEDKREIKEGILAHIREGTMELDSPVANHKWKLELEEGYVLSVS